MTKVALSEFVTGTCKGCGDKKVAIYRDSRFCEDCDGNYYRCTVCKTYQNRDDHCRHVFQNSDFEWMGAGVGLPAECQAKDLKKSLFLLFSLMPRGFAQDLKTAIASGRFYTWLVAPMIGGGGSLQLNGMPDRDGKFMVFAWGNELMEIGGGDRAEETRDGYRWLVSLYQKSTLKANHETTGWIDEWLKQQGAA